MLEDLKSLQTQMNLMLRQINGLIAKEKAEAGLPPEPNQFPTARKPRIT